MSINYSNFASQAYKANKITLYLTESENGFVLSSRKEGSTYVVYFAENKYSEIDWRNTYDDFASFVNYFHTLHN